MDSLSKSDRRVVLLLVVVAAGCLCLMMVKGAFGGEGEKVRGDEVERVKDGEGEEEKVELGTFDPNTVDSLTLVRYGLGSIQIRSLLNYRRHGGRFEEALAVSRLWNWTDEDVEKVLPYIVIEEENKPTYHYREQYEEKRRSEYEHSRKAYEQRVYDHEERLRTEGGEERRTVQSNKFSSLTKVDINTADTALLKRIPGVGNGIAKAIVEMRNRLGGFYSVEQLKEKEYISPELFEWFEVKSGEVKKINVNKASFQTLNAHPYIRYEQVKDLMKYRRLYGTIKDLHDLRGTNIFTAEELEKLEAYLEY